MYDPSGSGVELVTSTATLRLVAVERKPEQAAAIAEPIVIERDHLGVRITDEPPGLAPLVASP